MCKIMIYNESPQFLSILMSKLNIYHFPTTKSIIKLITSNLIPNIIQVAFKK